MNDYAEFLHARTQIGGNHGFEPSDLPAAMFDYQRHLTTWALRKGRAAILADCGLGKSLMQMVWASNVAKHKNGRVLICTPLAVGAQLIAEAAKFHVEDVGLGDGRIVVTNYERLHKFDPADFVGMVCDESSILKNFDGQRKAEITTFMRKMEFRLLCTATAAPNDYIELGTSSEALGELGHTDMLGRFFKNDQNSIQANRHWEGSKWRFKHHAHEPFWRWVSSWARACRMPSDLGFPDDRMILPPLHETDHVVKSRTKRPGYLFDMPAEGLQDQREEAQRTIVERCEKVAELVAGHDRSLVWCHRNDEGDLLERLIPGSVQVAGKHDEDQKEARLSAFANGETKVLITKPKIGAWGLNLQRCAHVTFFPSHSYEQYYQGIRRCWRFGQTRDVHVDIVATEGEVAVMANLRRKAKQAEAMFSALVKHMRDSLAISRSVSNFSKPTEVPSWL